MTDQTPSQPNRKPKATASLKKKLGATFAGIAIVTVLAAASHGGSQTKNLETAPSAAKSSSQVESDNTAKKPSVEHKTVTTTESVPFSATTATSPSLAKGVTKITTAGVNGVRTHTFDVTYTDGVETARTEISSEVTQAPVNQVTTVGTYVAPAPQPNCPNGTYVNTAGNTVCRPYASDGAPAGATAQCGDGTYSFSQSRSGTCSHHGGVARWL